MSRAEGDFCFYKQKTADEMRISDGSSDGCASDLLKGFEMTRHFLNLSDAGDDAIAAMLNDAQERKAKRAKWPKGSADADMPLDGQDRKSVVQGKSVSVRVDLGGRRMINNNNIQIFSSTPLNRQKIVKNAKS